MISLLKINYKENFTLIEPAIGEGHILFYVVENYFLDNKDKDVNKQVEFLEKNLAGFDIREEAIKECIKKLDSLSYKYIARKVDWNIKKFDALDRDNLIKKFGTYDYVISNPPYVSRHNMDNKIINTLRSKSDFCTKFNFDLYYYFFEIGFDLWNKNGKIVFITPNSYIKARSGEMMMEYLINNSLIETIIDYEDTMKFEGANTYTAVTVFSPDNKILRVKNGKGKLLVKVNYRTLIEKNRYKIYSHNFLTEVYEDYIDLGDFTEVRNGLATLQDKVFVINQAEIVKRTNDFLIFKKENKIFKVEMDGIKKVIRASSIEDEKYVIFPYIPSNEEKISYVQNSDIENQYNNIYKYLVEMLSDTYKVNYGVYFGRTQGFTCYYDSKIVIPKVASLEDSAFRIVDEGFLLSGLSIKLKKEYLGTDLNQVLDYLNSDVVRAYLTITSKNYAAGYKSISSTDLKKIKIPKCLIFKERKNDKGS
nr:Eco57I restriction-modification methylase domain-containing protein [Enterococcus sp. DIV0212c]